MDFEKSLINEEKKEENVTALALPAPPSPRNENYKPDSIPEVLTEEHLKFINDRTDAAGQWRTFWPLFHHFYNFLAKKRLKPKTISHKINCLVLFLINHLMMKTQIASIADVTEETIDSFIEEFYKDDSDATPGERKRFKKAIIDFFEFLKKRKLVSELKQN